MVWQSVGERWCETDNMCDKDVCVCKMVWKMVCDKDGVSQSVGER